MFDRTTLLSFIFFACDNEAVKQSRDINALVGTEFLGGEGSDINLHWLGVQGPLYIHTGSEVGQLWPQSGATQPLGI